MNEENQSKNYQPMYKNIKTFIGERVEKFMIYTNHLQMNILL